ncbi:hypothetical protein PIB30_107513, partial [Stylosanthes scabra]|nr:hypothetical protein [Stylosanthes scabra]
STVAASSPRKSQHSASSYLSPRLPSSSSKKSLSLRVRFPSPSSSLRLSRPWSSGKEQEKLQAELKKLQKLKEFKPTM